MAALLLIGPFALCASPNNEVDVTIADVYVDLYRRETRSEDGQQRQNSVMAIRGGHADTQGPGGRLLLTHHFALGFDQLRGVRL